MRRLRTSVLIVGGGPVGSVLALGLAGRGIDVIVAEQNPPGTQPGVKCNHVAARTMEIFRRLGIVDIVRNTGLPADHANDVAFRTTAVGTEFARIHIPCRRDRYTDKSGPDGWWPTPEPPHRINQIYLDPLLAAEAAAHPRVRFVNLMRVSGFTQDEAGITVEAEDLANGGKIAIDCAYLVGCDGPTSEVRRQIGARLSGDAMIGRTQSSYIRAPGLAARMQAAPAWSTQVMNPRRSANMFAVDGRETWLVHNYLRADEADFEAIDADGCLRDILGIEPSFDVKLISRENWIGRRLLADRFRDRRVFICGDAAHIWAPFAGYGMNAGIADATNLAWMLAGVLAGWADPAILEAHEAERWPITEQVSKYAMGTALALARARAEVPADIEAVGPEGDARRAELGQRLLEMHTPQFCCGGLNFGSFYDRSPIVAYDGEQAPAYTMDSFTPSTVPGCRTPHVWLGEGRSLYDAMGAGFTLLRFDRAVEAMALVEAAALRGVPLAVLDLAPQAPYREKLVLSRPDQHIAWRGDVLPRDPLELIDRIRGAQ
ncbi:MAG: FAD-dependent oxidoreductase [Reyranella sp.]|uniref:FAD-dependent oxidoreductase n=1 Tax=Reyranella sp. TaxID=1929291 RepID=UPI00272F863C|nr:FAD-dependent oxidoreductase [Reyranella sp.]MDP1964567.1 FAD-dependent oxidoreductase [Reyranella sp.]MDP2376510.1 FAD-dependent oxidoreductase [Reyranella sp.]